MRKGGLSREPNSRQSVELHRLAGPLKDALPTELYGHSYAKLKLRPVELKI